MELRPYQQQATDFLAARPRAALYDRPRVGKTFPTIRAADKVGARNILWMTTGSARLGHAKRWVEIQQIDRPITTLLSGQDTPRDEGVNIVSWALATTTFAEYFASRKWDVIVPDEAHRAMNRDTIRTKALYGDKCDGVGGFVEKADFVWPLTGTPTPSYAHAMWPTLRALAPERITAATGKPMAYWPFVNRYCRTIDDGFGIKIIGNRNAAELKQRLDGWHLRRTMADVRPEVPTIQVDTLPVHGRLNLPASELKLADEVAKALAKCTTDDQIIGILKKNVTHSASLRRYIGLAKVDGCIEWAKDRIEDGTEKLVILAYHREVIDAMKAKLGDKCLVITGDTSPKDREDRMVRFQRDPSKHYVLGQLQACGEAIDLSSADEVLIAESSWSPTDNDQGMLRVVNTEKLEPTQAWFAALAGSLDEQIQQTVARKTAEIAQLFD